MPKRDKPSKPNAAVPGKSNILDKLDGAESASVLKALLERHPELRSEAEALGKENLVRVSQVAVANDVADAVLQFDYDDLNGRAGSHSWGYVEPGEAACELLEEAIEPFVSEMKRFLELGLEEQAREVCQGILLGLYRVRKGANNEVLDWAEDFLPESAGDALDAWMSAAKADGAPRRLSSAFVKKNLPDWDWVLKLSAGDR
jgi:hypothetical protein